MKRRTGVWLLVIFGALSVGVSSAFAREDVSTESKVVDDTAVHAPFVADRWYLDSIGVVAAPRLADQVRDAWYLGN